jgi:hypothetical protein
MPPRRVASPVPDDGNLALVAFSMDDMQMSEDDFACCYDADERVDAHAAAAAAAAPATPVQQTVDILKAYLAQKSKRLNAAILGARVGRLARMHRRTDAEMVWIVVDALLAQNRGTETFSRYASSYAPYMRGRASERTVLCCIERACRASAAAAAAGDGGATKLDTLSLVLLRSAYEHRVVGTDALAVWFKYDAKSDMRASPQVTCLVDHLVATGHN